MNVNLHNPSHSTVRLTLSDVSFVYEAWQHMAILNAEVVMRPKHIGGDHGGIATAVLLKVGPAKHTSFIQTAHVFQRETIFFFFFSTVPVMDIDHSLCIGIAIVGLMRWAIVDLE